MSPKKKNLSVKKINPNAYGGETHIWQYNKLVYMMIRFILKQKCMPFIQTMAKTLLSSFLCNKAKTPPGYDFFAVHFTAI